MGALKKLEIIAYEDNTYSTETGNSFSMMVNPTSYSQQKGVRYTNDDAMDGGNNPAYQGYKDEKMNFEFIVDTTGVIQEAGDKDIKEIIKKLETTVYTYVGNAHESPYIKIAWGTLNYQGRMIDMEVSYTFFSPEGKPLRATVKLELLQYIDKKTQELQKKKSSPDLSHLITVKAGDTLPGLCQRIYKSTVYCTDIARINNLTGFRYIEPGTQLFFLRYLINNVCYG